MGLDQYAYTKKGKKQIDLQYWRKHNALQGWMQKLWEDKGFPHRNENDPTFNCVELNLTSEDIDKLEGETLASNLPQTSGFFFGDDSSKNEYKKEQTILFISAARQAIKDGEKVFYNSSW
jgi:hypothetical protein